MARSKEELSHNLAREWVTDRLAAARVKHATAESEWIGKGVVWPQTSGEYDDPTGIEEPEIVKVYVAVPAGIDEASINEMVDYLRAETDAEPRLGGRVEEGSMRDGQDDIEVVDDVDLGPRAQRVGLSFRISGPLNPVA
jgi:hypothetical protein